MLAAVACDAMASRCLLDPLLDGSGSSADSHKGKHFTYHYHLNSTTQVHLSVGPIAPSAQLSLADKTRPVTVVSVLKCMLWLT
jgi:hypothetical protein